MDEYNFVPKNYEMNPETECLISGRRLLNGMIVLMGNPELRQLIDRPYQEMSSSEKERALEMNRWVEVSSVGMDDTTVSFLGRYRYSGHPQTRFIISPVNVPWVLKRDSLRNVSVEKPEDNKKKLVLELVRDAMLWEHRAELFKNESADDFAKRTTKSILDLF